MIYIFLIILFWLVFNFYLLMKKFYILKTKRYISDITIKYLNQYYNELENDKKYVLARDIILEVLNSYHIKILETELDLLIESKVYDLKQRKL